MSTTNPALAQLGGYPLDRLQGLANQLRAEDAVLHDFSIGDPDEPTPSFIRQALIDAVGPVSRYPTAVGQPQLREAVVGWLKRRHGVEVDPDVHVVPTAGSKEAIFHLPLTVMDTKSPHNSVVWGDPGYPVYGRGAIFAGGKSDPVTLNADNGWRLDLGALSPARLHQACLAWVNYPHNPSGATVDVEYYREQIDIARANDIVFASDECYQEIWFDTPAPSVLEACDGDFTGVLAVVSLSKRSGMTGYRSGAIIGDPDLIARQKRLRPNVGTTSSDFVQAAATAAWSDQDHVEERRRIFAAKREVVAGFLHDAGIEVSGSDGTFYLWFRAPGGDDAAYAEALLQERILASPGRAFGPAGTGWVRLALVPDLAGCQDAVDAWAAAIDAGRLPS